jgi:hypothetical protein|tara:strand:- start:5656 stop:8244 length:2589 start_codon:yes stop_codon:yes gene_type:complete
MIKWKILLIVFVATFLIGSVSAAWTPSLNQDLTHYWTFNESSGNAMDIGGLAIGHQYNFSSPSYYNPQLIGNGVTLDGVTVMDTSGGTVGLPQGVSHHSISWWALAGNNVDATLISTDNGLTERVAMTGNNVNLIWGGGSSGSTGIGIEADNSTLWHFVLVRSNSTGRTLLYVNGSLKLNISSPSAITAANLRFGATATPDGFLRGSVDEVGVWNRTLSQAEVTQLYNNGEGITYSNELITLNSPSDGFQTISSTVTFNCSYITATTTPAHNISLYINGVRNLTNDTTALGLSDVNLYTRVAGLGIASYNWTCEGVDDNNVVSQGLNNTFSVANIFANTSSFNTTSYDLINESFFINMSYNNDTYTDITGTLNYNGTLYTGTKSGTGSEAVFTTSFIQPTITAIRNNTFYWTFNLSNSTSSTLVNSTFNNQTVHPSIFGLCNSTLNIPYINFTFADESDQSTITAKLDSSTWIYWVGDSSVNKTLSFSNSTTNAGYDFCFSPSDRDLTVDAIFKYSNDSYPQRTYSLDDTTLTNSTTNQVLYLLGSSDGIYSSISVIEASGTAIAGVLVVIERQINNVWTVVGQTTTGDDGLATFWVNPNFAHRVTASRTGYVTSQVTITPSQSLYTLTLQTTSAGASYTSSIPGLTWVLNPSFGTINAGSHNFNVTVTSANQNLENCRLELVEAANLSNVLASGTDLTNSTYCSINFDYTVVKDLDFFGRLSVDTDNTTGYVIVDADWKWIAVDIDAKAWRSITSFFGDLNTISEFGEGNEGEFSRIVLFFFFMTMAIGFFNYYTGSELNNPGMSILIIWIIVLIASVGGFLTFDSGSDNVSDTMEKFGFFFIFTISILGYILNNLRSFNE